MITLLIDYVRSFTDGRQVVTARSGKEAVTKLAILENKVNEIWLDNNFPDKNSIKLVLDFLGLRAKIGSPYPVGIIYVHSLDEGTWQLLNAKLQGQGYRVVRASIRNVLG